MLVVGEPPDRPHDRGQSQQAYQRITQFCLVGLVCAALEAFLFWGGAFRRRHRLKPVVGDWLAAFDRETVGALGESLLGPFNGR
jgi:hypothetical protein